MKHALFFMAASVAMLAACSRNEMDFQEKPSHDNGSIVEQVIFEVPDIRSLGEDGETRAALSQVGDGYLKFLWETTDTVGIYPDKGSQVYFEMAHGAGTNVANFDGGGWALKENSTYTSYYPFVCDMKLKRDAIPVSFTDQKQTGVSNYEGARFYLAAEGTSSGSGSLRFEYKTLNTFIRIKAIGLPAGTYTKLSLTTEEPLFVQEGSLSIDDFSITGKTYSNSIELSLENYTLTEATTEEKPVLFYVSSAPVDLTGKTMTVRIYSDDNRIFTCEKRPSKPFEAGSWSGYKCRMEEASVKYAKTSSITVGGTYLIVDANDGKLFKGGTDGKYDIVKPENSIITDPNGSLAGYEFTVENNGSNYYLRFNDGKYLVCNYTNGSSSGLYYVNTTADVRYPYTLTTGDNGAFFFSTTQVNSTSNVDQVLYFKTEEDIFKIGGSGRTIGVHLYMKDGKEDRGLSFNPKSVTCTLGDTPEKPVLSGIYTTVTYSSSNENIAKVDADGNVTPVSNGTVTITAKAEEDDQYGAGTASYTLNILKAAPGGWVAMETVNLENKALHDYLDDAENSYSDTDDATNTVMAKYVSGTYTSMSRKDCPAPVTITWTNSASSSTIVSIFENDSLENPIWTQNATNGATSADVYNLIPGRTYYYSVSENGVIWEKGYFSTTGRRRMLKVSDTKGKGRANNCRDLGGLKAIDNGVEKTLQYGILFRGTCMDNTTDDEKNYIMGFMNVAMDIDLRGDGTANSPGSLNNGNSICYQAFGASYNMGYISPQFASGKTIADFKKPEKIKQVFTAIFNTVKSGKSVYFHCHIGADRTGYIAMLIEGLLGVSEKDVSIDYELTSFSDAAGKRYRDGQPECYTFREGIEYLRNLPGTTFQNKIETYLVGTIGISQADINEFKGIMLK